jgi:hypothetical protein
MKNVIMLIKQVLIKIVRSFTQAAAPNLINIKKEIKQAE